MDEGAIVERLRQIWTPDKEVVEETGFEMSPQTHLDSMIRHILHALLQQEGKPHVINLDVPNRGVLRWEDVTMDIGGRRGSRLLNVWVETEPSDV